jgi:hypothetical protein
MEACNHEVTQREARGIRSHAEKHPSEVMADGGEAQHCAHSHNPSQRETRCNIQQKAEPSKVVVAKEGRHHTYENERERYVGR